MAYGNHTQSQINTSPPNVIRHCRQAREQTLEKFAEELGTYAGNILRWERGERGIESATLEAWWTDSRQWVRNLARDVLAAKFAGIREAFLAEAAQAAGNGREQAAQQ